MGFLDKALNKMMDIEEREVSTVELADMIEEKILKKECKSESAYNANLRLVKDAAKKDWILMIGNGGTTRDYRILESELTITVHYSVLTRTMQNIQLYDKNAKIIYSIPKGRENAKDLCAKLLARVERYEKQLGRI